MVVVSAASDRFGPNFSINQRWPKLINLEMLRSTICQADDQSIIARAAELQKRYNDLNCTCRVAKRIRDQLRRTNTDNQQTINLQLEMIQQIERNISDTQNKIEDCKNCISSSICEVELLQNHPAPRLLPSPQVDLRMNTNLEYLAEEIMEMYSVLLVFRAGQVVLFEDMQQIMQNRPIATRQLKQDSRELRQKIRDLEHAVINLTNEQKKWKGTLKEGKRNISRRARQQHLSLKEDAAKLKRTIELFQEEKCKLMQVAMDFENALNTTIGEKELAELMEHFEPLLNGRGVSMITPELPFQGNGPIRSMFKNQKITASPSFSRGKTPISGSLVDVAVLVCRLHTQWLDSAITKVKMEANLLRTGFDITLLEASLTAESYYDSKKSDEERRRGYRAMVSAVPSDELLNIEQCDIAEYFDPEVKFPGRNNCLSQS